MTKWGFIIEIQGWFDISKSINVVHVTNKFFKKTIGLSR